MEKHKKIHTNHIIVHPLPYLHVHRQGLRTISQLNLSHLELRVGETNTAFKKGLLSNVLDNNVYVMNIFLQLQHKSQKNRQ